MIALQSSGLGFCTRDYYEGLEPRLSVQTCGAPDSQYANECTVYLSGVAGSAASIDVNTNHPWYIDDLSLYTVPNWCSISLPSGLLTGYVTDKTLTFTDKGNNLAPFVQTFDLTLCNASDPKVNVTIHVIRNQNNLGL
ncbi:MAG: hypothetical protein FWG54_05010 [Bacteroidetes bacterium]|nr:hypothetical protein [Bacteroidota bacterium]